ncbi:aldehyde dehydrogenase family 3 member B1-like isoform X2 [Sycon ciliatum]
MEVMLTEVATCRAEISAYLKKLKSWMKPEHVSKSIVFLGESTYIQRQPYGVVLIIAPWNYPFYLLLVPLIGAIAAGNCVVIKPSEVSVESEKLVREQLHNYLPEECFPVVCGGPRKTTELLKQRFDYIFFTGSTFVGQIVMKAAAEHLTPVTLELSGKCPTFVDASSDMQCVANRIVANKSLNIGQACISYDYIMCTKETQERLVKAMKTSVEEFFENDMQNSASWGRVINARHFDRIYGMLENSKGQVAIDGGVDKSDLFMGLTVLTDVKENDSTMKDEIFGPLLVIMPVSGLQEAIDFINSKEKPLAAYVHARDNAVIREFEENTSSGALLSNDSAMNMSVPDLPFGGVGRSGMGAYHGKLTFETFSHRRAVMHRKQALEGVNKKLRYPPYTAQKTRRLMAALFTTEDTPHYGLYIGVGLVLVGALVAIGVTLGVTLY